MYIPNNKYRKDSGGYTFVTEDIYSNDKNRINLKLSYGHRQSENIDHPKLAEHLLCGLSPFCLIHWMSIVIALPVSIKQHH